jgi:hypothetical protein
MIARREKSITKKSMPLSINISQETLVMFLKEILRKSPAKDNY